MADSSFRFEDLIHQFIALYGKGEYAQALQMLEINGERFPENEPQVIVWKAAMFSRLGRVDEAIQVLETAYTRGYWCHEAALQGDPDFEPLQNHPGFADLVERMAARRKEAIQQAQPDRVVLEPSGPGPHPLFLALHGNYSNISITEPLWHAVVDRGWLLAVPQSSQPGWTSGIFVWDDIARSTAGITTHLAELGASYAIDPQLVIAGGFSMGAHMAVRMALDPAFHLRGVVAMETWFDDAGLAELEQMLHDAPHTQARVVLIAGQENEAYMTMACKVRDLLTGHGMACQLIASSNAQHAYPPEFERLLLQAIDWIMC